MRRDDIRRLSEQRKTVFATMHKLNEDAEKENRSLSAEENEQFEKMAVEFEELKDREERATKLFMQEREVEQTLATPLEKRIGDDGDSPGDVRRVPRADARHPPAGPARGPVGLLEVHDGRQPLASSTWRSSARSRARPVPPATSSSRPTSTTRSSGRCGSWARSRSSATEYVTDNGDSIQVPANTAHGTAVWTAESASNTPSDETFAQITLGANKATSKIIVSEELLQDSAFSLDSFLAREFGERIGVLENTAYIQGSGSGKPHGPAPVLGDRVEHHDVHRGAGAGNATDVHVFRARDRAFSRCRRSTATTRRFIVNDTSARNLYLMVDSQNRPLWNVNMATTGPDTFLGYPIYTDPDVPGAGDRTTSPCCSATGSARTWSVVSRGFSMQRQNELHSDNGQVGFRASGARGRQGRSRCRRHRVQAPRDVRSVALYYGDGETCRRRRGLAPRAVHSRWALGIEHLERVGVLSVGRSGCAASQRDTAARTGGGSTARASAQARARAHAGGRGPVPPRALHESAGGALRRLARAGEGCTGRRRDSHPDRHRGSGSALAGPGTPAPPFRGARASAPSNRRARDEETARAGRTVRVLRSGRRP
jgi:hypothetical protein